MAADREKPEQGTDRARPGSEERSSATSDQLRSDIDSGRTGDKVAHPDPASVPLGTDAEAGGNPPTEEQVSSARQHELERRPERAPPTQGSEAERPAGARRWVLATLLALAVIVALVALAMG